MTPKHYSTLPNCKLCVSGSCSQTLCESEGVAKPVNRLTYILADVHGDDCAWWRRSVHNLSNGWVRIRHEPSVIANRAFSIMLVAPVRALTQVSSPNHVVLFFI